jgi:hypothetical protein
VRGRLGVEDFYDGQLAFVEELAASEFAKSRKFGLVNDGMSCSEREEPPAL